MSHLQDALHCKQSWSFQLMASRDKREHEFLFRDVPAVFFTRNQRPRSCFDLQTFVPHDQQETTQ